MRVALRRLPFEAAAPVVFGMTIVAVALGSSSVPDVSRVGRPLRWLALAGLVLIAAAAARRLNPGRPRIVRGLLLGPAVLAGLAALSTAWSVDPRLGFARAVTLAAAFAAATALSLAAWRSPTFAHRLVLAIVGAAAVVFLLGAVVAVVEPAYAIQAAGGHGPARFRGLGQNPNTMPMLYALAVPFAWWLTLTSRVGRSRLAAALTLAGLTTAIVVSGSRGATLAAMAALALVSVLMLPRWHAAAAVVGVVAAFAVGVGATQAVRWDYQAPEPTAPAAELAEKEDPYPFLRGHTPLGNDPNEVGRPLPGRPVTDVTRTFLGSSGRLQAWRGAVGQARGRPLLGYGFGTEEQVFVDRYYTFQGARPENAFIGTTLQLGVAGLLVLLATLAAFAVALVRIARNRVGRRAAAPFAGAVAAGSVLMLVQSYVTSVGNVAMLTFWCSLLVVGALSSMEVDAP